MSLRPFCPALAVHPGFVTVCLFFEQINDDDRREATLFRI